MKIAQVEVQKISQVDKDEADAQYIHGLAELNKKHLSKKPCVPVA